MKKEMSGKKKKISSRSVDVCIVGGGASGLMAAICAGRRGKSVLLLEKKNRAGKKLLATGNGKCNYSNWIQKPECYRGSSPVLCGKILEKFSVEDTVEWFREIGILPTEREGYLYPASGQASSVLRALEREIMRAGVEVHTEEEVIAIERQKERGRKEAVAAGRQKGQERKEIVAAGKQKGQDGKGTVAAGWQKEQYGKETVAAGKQKEQDGKGTVAAGKQEKTGETDGFFVRTTKGCYVARAVILATGGMASPVHGSTGDGYGLAKKLGHRCIAPVPALTSLVLSENFTKQWAGVRVKGMVSLYNGAGRLLAEDRGEIQMVSYGISGIPVFQVSRFAAVELAAGKTVTLVLRSMPDWQEGELYREFLRRRERAPEQSMGDLLDGILPDKLAAVYLKLAGNLIARPAGETQEKEIRKLAGFICHLELAVKEVCGFDKAQVTAGGIPLEEIHGESMESRCCPGLYLTGELLDVDGICGGYNLQWAWTTGYLAGCAAVERQITGTMKR